MRITYEERVNGAKMMAKITITVPDNLSGMVAVAFAKEVQAMVDKLSSELESDPLGYMWRGIYVVCDAPIHFTDDFKTAMKAVFAAQDMDCEFWDGGKSGKFGYKLLQE